MTTLLIDLGNTALKWADADHPDEPQTFVHHGSDYLPDELVHAWLRLAPDVVVGCMVTSENLALAMAKFFNRHRIQWEWLRSARLYDGDFKLYNRYDNFQQLGSDRWHAAIGAVSLHPGRPLVVVHLGTATTIDTVTPCEDGLEFQGGRILPGPAMMYQSLIEKTRCRPGGIGFVQAFPKNTADAISTGILDATLGAMTRTCGVMERRGWKPKIVFAGGAAPLLAPYIQQEFPDAALQHNLVLRGLAHCRTTR
ncbi:MAG: type III pantothenate kinase [Duodenibacillus sp.]|nr:type III pantothenate kinase [Duodenibacillus sp.]